jgi:hypothetical protein
MKSKTLLFVVAASLLLGAIPLLGHHGDAGRYEDTLTTLNGTVVEVQLVDPHCILIIDVPDEKGQSVRWQAELNGRTLLTKQFGWNRNTLKFGDKVTVVGRRVKSGAPYMNLTDRASITMVDTGKEIFSVGKKNLGQP